MAEAKKIILELSPKELDFLEDAVQDIYKVEEEEEIIEFLTTLLEKLERK